MWLRAENGAVSLTRAHCAKQYPGSRVAPDSLSGSVLTFPVESNRQSVL